MEIAVMFVGSMIFFGLCCIAASLRPPLTPDEHQKRQERERKATKYMTRLLVVLCGVVGLLATFHGVNWVQPHTLHLLGKSITLPQSAWAKMEDELSFAKNFEERTQEPWHEFGRVVTVFMLPMTPDRREGLTNDHVYYVELFVVHPGLVTVQTRIDKGTYWVLCRETFVPTDNLPVDISVLKPFMSEPEQLKLVNHYLLPIGATRHLLMTQF